MSEIIIQETGAIMTRDELLILTWAATRFLGQCDQATKESLTALVERMRAVLYPSASITRQDLVILTGVTADFAEHCKGVAAEASDPECRDLFASNAEYLTDLVVNVSTKASITEADFTLLGQVAIESLAERLTEILHDGGQS